MELVTIAKQDPYRTPQSTLAAAVDQQAPAGTAGPNSPTIRRARFIRRQMQQQAQQQQQLLQQQQPQPTTGATQ